MFSYLKYLAGRLMLVAAVSLCLSACGGGGDDQDVVVTPPAPQVVSKVLEKPVLSFSDTGLNVTDGVTRIGAWKVSSLEGWEYSFNMGATWSRGQADFLDVKGDGAKTIWVRARDEMGNTSEVVMVTCVLDTMPPVAVQAAVVSQDLTRLVKISGVEEKGQWEYSVDDQRTWLPGTGNSLALMGNALQVLWLRQIDLAGNLSPSERVNLMEPGSPTWHEASGVALQPSMLSLQQAQTAVLHGSVIRGDIDYIRWDIPVGQRLTSMRMIHYVSPDPIAFFALQRSMVFDAGIDVNRMLVYGHMGPPDLQRNVLEKLAPAQLTAGPMTLWFQQTGAQATEYAIELVFQTAE